MPLQPKHNLTSLQNNIHTYIHITIIVTIYLPTHIMCHFFDGHSFTTASLFLCSSFFLGLALLFQQDLLVPTITQQFQNNAAALTRHTPSPHPRHASHYITILQSPSIHRFFTLFFFSTDVTIFFALVCTRSATASAFSTPFSFLCFCFLVLFPRFPIFFLPLC